MDKKKVKYWIGMFTVLVFFSLVTVGLWMTSFYLSVKLIFTAFIALGLGCTVQCEVDNLPKMLSKLDDD
jgi:uncharacterized protein YqfA (UPF0365 family)